MFQKQNIQFMYDLRKEFIRNIRYDYSDAVTSVCTKTDCISVWSKTAFSDRL